MYMLKSFKRNRGDFMLYTSSRNSGLKIPFSKAVLKGISDDGGLFVPESFPKLDVEALFEKKWNYVKLCTEVMKGYLPQIEDEKLEEILYKSYSGKFAGEDIVKTVKAGDVAFLELFHGPTMAFKDMALSVLPYLIAEARSIEKSSVKTVILAATSGDTGKAALEAFRDVGGTEVIVVFPEHGVSQIQKIQMKTQQGDNLHVIGIDGNFDDAQNAVKRIFKDQNLTAYLRNKNMSFSSANSINIGRLLPQTVYYFYAYFQMIDNGCIKPGDKLNFCVPTGNFGDILAGYYAQKMGLPVNRLICASNENKILTDFFRTGVYDINRMFFKTKSPSMDILVSSNLERLLFHVLGSDQAVLELMDSLYRTGRFEIDTGVFEESDIFYAGFCGEEESFDGIRHMHGSHGYIMDTHTAVAYGVYGKYLKETGDCHKTIILSTASPFKFSDSICDCLGIGYDTCDIFSSVRNLAETTHMPIPVPLVKIMDLPLLHDSCCKVEDLTDSIINVLEVRK